MSWPPNAWPQSPSKPQWSAHCYHPNHQQYPQHLYEHLSYPVYPSNHPEPYFIPSSSSPSPSPSYPVSPHISRARTFPLYNHVPPRFTLAGHPHSNPHPHHHQTSSSCIITPPRVPSHYAEQRRVARASRTRPPVHSCANLLDIELEEPSSSEPLPHGARLLSEKLSRQQEGPCPEILHQDLLDMFQYVYGRMLKSVERIADHWLRDRVSCTGSIRRFDERRGWQPCDSRLVVEGENFFCAPYIVVSFAKLPHRTTIKELVELVRTHCLPHGEHMMPAFKFKDRENCFKFEPGMVYLTVDAKHLIAKPVVKKSEHRRASSKGRKLGNGYQVKEIEYYNDEYEEKEKEGKIPRMGLGRKPKDLRKIKKYARISSKRCKDTVKRIATEHFGVEPKAWVKIENLEFRFNNWYPLGSADETFGLITTSREIVEYDDYWDADNTYEKGPEREKSGRELYDIAPTLCIKFPVNQPPSIKGTDSSNGPLLSFVEDVRCELSAISTAYGQFAIIIFWGEDKNSADWFGPEVVYKPTGEGEKYMASKEGCEK